MMSSMGENDADIFTSVAAARGTRWRSTALVMSVMSLFLPAITVSNRLIGYEIDVIELATWSLVAPLTILAAIGWAALSQRWGWVSDILAALCALATAGFVIFMRYYGEAPILEGFGQQAGPGVTVGLGAGVISLVIAAVIMAWQPFRSAVPKFSAYP